MEDSGHGDEPGMLGAVRRAVSGAVGAGVEAVDATVGRVGHSVTGAALDLTQVTAEQVIADLEPYLINEAIPRIIDGITPYLSQTAVPGIVDGLQDHLTHVVVPGIIDGLSPYLSETAVPGILAGLEEHLVAVTVPRIIDGLVPYLEADVVPQVVDALMPKIRNEIVPTILDDIVDDPRVRDLIREQSQGLVLDALEKLRKALADLDDTLDRVGRVILRRGERVAPAEGAQPQPGRQFAHAGLVTRGISFAIDGAIITFVLSTGLSSVLSVLESVFGSLPGWVAPMLTFVAFLGLPLYLALCWSIAGRTLGEALLGVTVHLPSGGRPHFMRAFLRALASVGGLIVWVITAASSMLDGRRRTWLDLVSGTEVRYHVPDNQKRRYLREAELAARQSAQADSAVADLAGGLPPSTDQLHT